MELARNHPAGSALHSWMTGLVILLLVTGCATSAPKSALSSTGEDLDTRPLRLEGVSGASAGGGPLILAESNASSSTRIGWIYRIEGLLDDQPVRYVGSAADLKQRLTSQHQWARLLQQDNTKVYAMEVFAELDVQASNRQTLMSARNEALRAAEQRALEQLREQVERTNLRRSAGQAETRILNEINASQDAAAWEARHRVTTNGKWQLFERSMAGTVAWVLVVMTLVDAYLMYHHAKMSRYVMAPYVLEDEQGLFILQERTSLLSSQHYKAYVSGEVVRARVEISADEFRGLKREAEALWGTTDWAGDFVPGLLNRELPVIEHHDGI